MNKQEILDEINKTKEHLANMEKMLEECNERWEPEENKTYYYVSSNLEVRPTINHNDLSDVLTIKAYNCFRTEEEAEQEAEKILIRRQLENIARRLNKGVKIDWHNQAQIKYAILFLTSNDSISCVSSCMRKIQGAVYCLDIDFYEIAIQEIGEERLKKYLRGE